MTLDVGGVGEIDGLGIIIEHQIFYVDMFQRRRNGLCIGRGRGVAFPRVMPQPQHRARRNVRRTVGGGVNGVLTPAQECVQLIINSHWRGSGPGVDVVQVHNVVVVVIDIKQLVIAR